MAVQVDDTLTTVPHDAWCNHIQSAVNNFLKSAVVIDNQPYVCSHITSTKNTTDSSSVDSGLGDEVYQLDAPTSSDTGYSYHNIDIRTISDEFTRQGIACAFVLPDNENNDRKTKQERAVTAAKIADLVVIDWYLEEQDPSLTMDILESISQSDNSENGRLRLICVYTGEPLNEHLFRDVITAFSKGGISVNKKEEVPFCAIGPSTILIVKNKSETPTQALPSELINLFSHFANGLIPAFAFAGVGAIRKNIHHMLTRFKSVMDPAYISNRLITDPPGDVTELMRELLVSECDNALGLERIADDYLESHVISLWLDEFSSQITPVTCPGKNQQTIEINRQEINNLLVNGVGDNRIAERQRKKISHAISGSEENSNKAQNEFSRLVAFRREAYGSTTRLMNENWLPSLTTGTILRIQEDDKNKYLMCFTPACDMLRLNNPRPFVFIEGQEQRKPYSLVIINPDETSVGIHFDKKQPVIRTLIFKPDQETQRVRAINEEGKYIFTTEQSECYEWLGEIRYNRATSEMVGLANQWMRIGIIDSEYLRLATKKHIEFN